MAKIRMFVVAAWLGICAVGYVAAEEGAWEVVQKILMSTKDIVVLDGIEKVPLRYEGEEDPTYGDWLVRHMLSDPEKLNPYTSSDAGASQVLEHIFERLLDADHDPPYNLRGRVAVGYPEIAADKLTYTFELRDGVYFSDGKPLTAADVVFSMKVIHNPQVLAPHLRHYYATVQDVQIVGTNKIRFLCREPYFSNDLILGGFYILPRHFYDPEGLMDPVEFKSLVDGSWEGGPHEERIQRFAEQFNQNFNRKALGSGQYLIEDPERDLVTQQKVVLTRNKSYWGRDVEGLLSPGFVDKIVFNIINNTDAAFIELTNGHLDYHSLRPLEFKKKSWSDDFNRRFLKGVSYSSGYVYIGWNNNHPIFGDKRVRQAMTYLTDREGIVENIMFGLAETVEGPINKFRPEYNHDLAPYAYDPDRALDLLSEAGWADADEDGVLDKTIDEQIVPFRFEILINSGNQIRKDIALTVQYELQDIGIDCQVRELDWSIFLQKVKSKDFDAMVLGWTGSLRFAPDGYQIWHSSQAVENGSNHVSFINSEVDSILEAYRREFDMDKRIKLYRRFQEILHEEQPYTFMWKSRSPQAYSRRFSGVTWHPPGVRLQDWWVAQEEQMY